MFVSRYQSPEILKPTDGTFDFPSAFDSPQFPSVLSRRFGAVRAMFGDQLDSHFLESGSQGIAIGGGVIQQSPRLISQNAIFDQRFDQSNFVRASAGDLSGARKPVGIDQEHDLGPFASLGLPYAFAPFFAGENVPSAIVSEKSTWPSRRSLPSRRLHALVHIPLSVHSLNRRQHVLGEGKWEGISFQRAPDRNSQTIASKQSRGHCGGRPPWGDRGLSGNRSEIRRHCSSVSSNSGSILDPIEARASSQWDRFITKVSFNH